MVMVMVKVLKLDTIDIIEVVPGLGNTILEYIYIGTIVEYFIILYC